MHFQVTCFNWQFISRFLFPFCGRLLTLLTLQVSFSFAANLLPHEQQALSMWGKQQFEMGALQNPPAGAIPARAKAIEAHIRATIIKLRPDFFEKYQLSIGVYATPIPNAFMARVSPYKVRMVQRKFFGFDTKKPIYQLGVSYGLYQTLRSLDEVEAVIAHELIHLLEGHVDDRPDDFRGAAKHWFASERYEAVTDHLALELMQGHVDLDALRDALWNLAEYKLAHEDPSRNKNEWTELIGAIGAAVSSHHDRGVRIGSVQAQAEYLRTQNKNAQPLPRRSIPQVMKGYDNPRDLNNEKALTFEQKRKFALLVTQLAEKIAQGEDKHLPIVQHLLRDANFKDLKTTENLFTSKLSPDDASLFEIAEIIQETILNNQSLTREQKIAHLWIAAELRNRRGLGDIPFEKYLHGYAKAIIQAMGGQQINWLAVAKMTHESPASFLQEPLASLIFATTEGRKLYRLAFMANLFLPAQQFDNWTEQKISDRLNFSTLGNNLINYPFVYKHNKEEKEKSYPFQNFLKRLFIEELDRLVPFLQSQSFRDTVFNSGPDSQFSQFMFFVEGRTDKDRDLREDSMIKKSKFIQAAVALQAEGVEFGNQVKMRLLSRVASQTTALSPQDVADLSQAFDITSYSPLRKEEAQLLGKIYFNALESFFQSPSDMYFSAISRFLAYMIQTETVPMGTPEQNIRTLWALSLSDLPSKRESQGPYERLLQKLISTLGFEQVKSLMLAPAPVIFEKRFQDKLNSDSYKERKREYIDIYERANAPDLPFHKASNLIFEMMSKQMYFKSHEMYSNYSEKTTFGILSLLNLEVTREETLKTFTLSDIDRTIRSFYRLKNQADRRKKLFVYEPPKKDSDLKIDDNDVNSFQRNLGYTQEISFLLSAFARHQNSISDLKTWAQMYRSLLTISASALDTVPELKEGFEKKFLELTRNGQDPQSYLYIRGPHLRKGLSEMSLVPVLFEEFKRQAGDTKDPIHLRQLFVKMEEEQKLKSDLTDVYEPLREKIAETFRLQPNAIEIVFPDSDTKINTKNTEGLDGEIRGLSGVINYARQRSFDDQLQLMEYLMGRRATIPEFVAKWQKETNHPIASMLYGMKLRLARESDVVRAFTLNTLMTGPDGFAEKPGAQEYLLDYFFKDSSNKDIANEIAQGLLRSLGRDKSFAYAYILAQKPTGNGKMDEGEILKALLEVVFGVPGKKLGQYLAFVGELGSLRDALAKLQDSASPLSYLEILKLVNKQMGLSFAEKWEVVRALGSGSVNIAVEILSKKMGEARVISVLREAIEIAAANDFRRLQSLVVDLAEKNPERYGFLPGLLKIIQKSVSLEFDKANSFERQKAAGEIYKKQVNGWTLKAPIAYNHTQFSLEMEKATGKTAVKIRKQNFPVYQETMRIVLEAEFDHLLNSHIIFGRRLIPLAFANPDLHDGQVIIDVEKKIVTILDFGQAVSITQKERDFGLMIVRMLAQTEDSKDFAKQIQKLQKAFGGKNNFTAQEIQTAFAKKDLMDRFIYFLGIAGNHEWDVSIATVHFILGINRLLKLSDVVGYDLTRRLTTILKVREFTRSTELGATIEGILKSYRKESSNLRTCRSLF